MELAEPHSLAHAPKGAAAAERPLELWAGAECTVNRVGDTWRDQLRLTGHHDRAEDIDLVADLGVAALRFPVLWERVSPEAPDRHDWAWSDDRLERVRRRGMRAIAGLVHHGSGPHYTSLLAPDFAQGLARHALAVARRYPWIEEWTPVNEPMTTARFSALYGIWYPHERDERQFWTALLNEIDGVRLSMQAIRSVNPQARLIQTDDLGRTYSTALLAEQAAFDNGRRWLGWDLLCGMVGPEHPFWERLCGLGLGDRLRAVRDDPCPPDVIGINHYLTSDRFLDHRLQRYPASTHGGNGRLAYADVEAVRVLEPAPPGLHGALTEAWHRYGIPLAVTEAHNGCTRDEQARWTLDAWEAALAVRAAGADVRAVTSWAVFGSQGWNTLLTGPGVYEPGAFDCRGGRPRPTAMTRVLKSLAEGRDLHPSAGKSGWWSRDIRLEHPPVSRAAPLGEHRRGTEEEAANDHPILLLGATGTLGRALASACRHRNLGFVLAGRPAIDLRDPASIDRALELHRPAAVVSAAGWVRVDDAEAEPDACHAANAEGAIALARACDRLGIPTVSFSSDLVFGGGKPREAYVESDPTAPLNVYGESKARMEEGILSLPGSHLVVRTAAFFSPWDRHNFAIHAVAALRRGQAFVAAADCTVTPTYVPDLCDATLDLLLDGASGLWHLTNGEALTWAGFAVRIAEACGLDPSLVRPVPAATLGWTARRPPNCALASERGSPMPPLASALTRFAANLPPGLNATGTGNAT